MTSPFFLVVKISPIICVLPLQNPNLSIPGIVPCIQLWYSEPSIIHMRVQYTPYVPIIGQPIIYVLACINTSAVQSSGSGVGKHTQQHHAKDHHQA